MTRFGGHQDIPLGNPLVSDGDHNFTLGEPRGFKREKKDGSGDSIGFFIPVTTDSGVRPAPLNFYVHTEGALRMTHQFVAACYGLNVNNPEDEERYKTQYMPDTWVEVDDDDNVILGPAIKNLRGRRVTANVTNRMNDVFNRTENQFRWRPFEG